MKIRKITRAAMLAVGCLLVAAGAAAAIMPYAVAFYLDHKAAAQIEAVEGYSDVAEAMQDGTVHGSKTGATMDESDMERKISDPLYQAMSAYNVRIHTEGQSGIADIGTFENLPEELEMVIDGAIGYIEIPSINVKLPLYVGASDENMANGAAILSNTSMPIGGKDTNCVIAGHRGYYGGKFFKDIEEIAIGDSVLITNAWETLEYVVEGFDIIEPSDADAVKIHEGKDLVTLLTCHPYASNGKYRYLVFCAPAGDGLDDGIDVAQEDFDVDGGTSTQIVNTKTDGAFESSKKNIMVEEGLRMVSLCLMVIVIVVYLICMIRRHRKKSV